MPKIQAGDPCHASHALTPPILQFSVKFPLVLPDLCPSSLSWVVPSTTVPEVSTLWWRPMPRVAAVLGSEQEQR